MLFGTTGQTGLGDFRVGELATRACLATNPGDSWKQARTRAGSGSRRRPRALKSVHDRVPGQERLALQIT